MTQGKQELRRCGTTGITYSDKEINSILEDYRNGAVKTLPARDVTRHGNEVAVIAC